MSEFVVTGKKQNLLLHFRKLDGLKKADMGGHFIVEVSYNNKEPQVLKSLGGSPEWNQDVLIQGADAATEFKVIVKRKASFKTHAYGGFKFTINDGANPVDYSMVLEKLDKEELSSELEGIVCTLSFKATMQSLADSLNDLAGKKEDALKGDHGLKDESKREDVVDKVNDAVEFVQKIQESSEGIQNLLEKAEWFMNLVEKLSNIHPFAKVGFEVLTGVYKVYKFQRERDKAVLGLIDTMNETFDLVKQAAPDADELGDEIQTTMLEISKESVKCAHFVQGYCRQKTWKRFRDNLVSDIGTKTTNMKTILEKLKTKLASQANIKTLTGVGNIKQDLAEISADVKEVKESARDQELREKLPRVQNEGGHISAQEDKGCHPGTRIALIQDIERWINTDIEDEVKPDVAKKAETEPPQDVVDLEPGRLLVLTGLAGTGKSAIMHTLASRYRQVHCLGCAFFFYPTSGTNLGKLLFPTIAHDLADEFPAFKETLYSAVKRENHPRDVLALKDQYKKWITNPLQACGPLSAGPIIFFVDGLDECDKGSRDEFAAVLEEWVVDVPPNFRLILTSRTGDHIDTILEIPNTKHIDLSHKDLIKSTSGDIRTFMQDGLRRFDAELRLNDGYSSDWIEKLVIKSELNFQWAATALNFIEDEGRGMITRAERVRKLLSDDPQTADMGVLDRLYVSVLQAIFQTNEGDIERFRSVMGTIFVLKQPLPAWTLEYLFKDPSYSQIVVRLASVLEFANNLDTSLRPLHSSFREFLLNENLSRRPATDKDGGYNFWVGPLVDHQLVVTQTCLKLTITTQMKGDFSVAPEPWCEALRYAFRHWPHHFCESDNAKRDALANDVDIFIKKRCLHWANTLQKMKMKPTDTRSEDIVQLSQLQDMLDFLTYPRNVSQDRLKQYLQCELLLAKITCFSVLDVKAVFGKEKAVYVVECEEPPYNIFKANPTFERACEVTSIVAVRRNPNENPLIISGWSDGTVRIQRHGEDKLQPADMSHSQEPVVHIVASTPFSGCFVVVHEDGGVFSFKLQDGEMVLDQPRMSTIKTPSPLLISGVQDSVCVMKNDMVALLCANPWQVLIWDCERSQQIASYQVPSHIPEISRLLFQEIPTNTAFAGLAVVVKGNITYLCDAAGGFNTAGFLPPVVQLRLLVVRKFTFQNGRRIVACKWEEGVLAAYDRRYPKPLHFVAKEVA